jgi:hypothetical protein
MKVASQLEAARRVTTQRAPAWLHYLDMDQCIAWPKTVNRL